MEAVAWGTLLKEDSLFHIAEERDQLFWLSSSVPPYKYGVILNWCLQDYLNLADSETNQRSSTQEENAANMKHDSRRKDVGRAHKDLDDANYILYQTVLQKNKELDSTGLQLSKPDVNIMSKGKSFKGDVLVAPADTVLCHGGFSISSES
jgi:hypothetical protein